MNGPSAIFYIIVIVFISMVLRDAGVITFLANQFAGVIGLSTMALEGKVPQ